MRLLDSWGGEWLRTGITGHRRSFRARGKVEQPLDARLHSAGEHVEVGGRLALGADALLELSGESGGAAEAYALAARLTTSLPERRYLEQRAQAASRVSR